MIPHRFRLWLRGLLRPRTVERELTEELRHHLELETAKNIRVGMSPSAARRKAMIEGRKFKDPTSH